jgi:hypothetical protein
MTAGIKANVDGSAAIQVGGSDAINISSGLNVGIGTSSPSGRLHVESSSGGLPLYVNSTASAQNARIRLNSTDNASSVSYVMSYSHASLNKQAAMLLGGTGAVGFYVGQTAGAEPTTGTLAQTIDSSGNVGIGTSSPAHKLDVRGSGNTYLRIEDTQANGYNAATLYKNDQRQFRVGVLGTVGGFTNGALVVYDETAAAWRMVIDSGGNLLINATTRASLEKVNITSDGASQEGLIIVNTNTAAGTHTAIGFRRPSSTTVGNITTTLSSTAYVTSSDYRLKENVQPMTGALSKVAALKPCTYTWKIDGSSGQGFIAHELAEVVPDAVSGEKDAVNGDGSINPQGIDTSFLVATLTAAIQEQQQMIETLQAKVAALEGA